MHINNLKNFTNTDPQGSYIGTPPTIKTKGIVKKYFTKNYEKSGILFSQKGEI